LGLHLVLPVRQIEAKQHLHLATEVTGMLVKMDLHHNPVLATHLKEVVAEAEAEAVLQDLQDLQEEEDHPVVDLQAQVEAVVDHQEVDHLLQL
jgi:hypothetical protein